MELSMSSEANIKSPFVVTITSGKGGVGKSVLTANLANSLANLGLSVLIWDANMMFPNQHILIGVEPPIRLDDVYNGNVSVKKAAYKIKENLFLLADKPASGFVNNYNQPVIVSLFQELLYETDFDIILIDTPAGAPEEVMHCAAISDLVNIVITDEPTSLLDAYGLIKILLEYIGKDKINLLLNNVIDLDDADEIAFKLNLAAENFLGFKLEVAGFVPYDRVVRQSILRQELFTETHPQAEASEFVMSLAERMKNKIMESNSEIKTSV